MARVSFTRLAALAGSAALGLLIAVPAQAQDADAPAGVEVAQADSRGGGHWQQRAARAEVRSDRREVARESREWRGNRGAGAARVEQRAAPDGGWRSRRSVEGQRQEGQRQRGGWNGGEQAGARPAESRLPDRGAIERRAWRQERSGAVTVDRAERNWDQRRGSTWQGREPVVRRDIRNGTRWDGNRESYRSGSRYGDVSRRYRPSTRGWNTDWRRDSRYDWSGYRSYNRDIFRGGRYYSPYRNYSYRRLSIGFFLEPLFFGQRYVISDPWQYRLPDVDGPYRWVRYYDDVLLVDIYSGEVVDVIHDFFW